MFPILRNTCSLSLHRISLRKSLHQTAWPWPRHVYDVLPKSLHPYVRSSRIEKPIGSWVIYLPSAWSIAFAGTTMDNIALLGLFGMGAVLMRGAGCTINDILDKNYDRHVERTKSRPIASGQISVRQAMIWTGIQLSLAFLVLIQLNIPTICIGTLSLIPVAIYPIMKRYTYWPQLFLGATLNWGVFMGYTAATGSIVPSIIIPLYFASIAWTLHYDTIYAHQDKQDDLRAGVKSTALLLGNDSKLWLRTFNIVMISHLITVGLIVDQTWPYYVGLVGAGYHLYRQVECVDLNAKQSCWNTFVSNRLTGLIILGCILVGNLFK